MAIPEETMSLPEKKRTTAERKPIDGCRPCGEVSAGFVVLSASILT